MKELISSLHSIHPLSPSLKRFLQEKLKTRTVDRKGFLLRAGSVNRHIYFIKQGLLRCYYIENDKEVCSKFMKEGDIIVSASSFFRQVESYEFIQALEDSVLWYLCYEELQCMYKYFPEFNIIAR